MNKFLSIFSIIVGLGATAHAEPMDLRQISAEAKWLAHIDFDAARESSSLRRIEQSWLSQPAVQAQLQQIIKCTGTDPFRDLHSVTLYGRQLRRFSGVMIAQGDVHDDYLVKRLREHPGYRVARHGDRDLHTWIDCQGTPQEHLMSCSFHDSSTVIFGHSAIEVAAALDVMHGNDVSLARKPSVLAAPIPDGIVLIARATDLEEADLAFKSPLIRQSLHVSVAAGEQEGVLFIEGTLVVKSREVASKVRDVLEGFRAMADLQYGTSREISAVLQKLQVTTNQERVTLDWRVPAEDVLRGLDKIWMILSFSPAKAD